MLIMNFHPKTFLASNYFTAQEAALMHIQFLGTPQCVCQNLGKGSCALAPQ